ncbi:MAG: SRPBCC domain-containing protein [Chloroflexota bacterium]|nr:SRPBCC domain-containing protein [Chloroflexota bacterium]
MSLDIRLKRVIDAAPEAVFRHWVDPVARRSWYAPAAGWIIEAESDLRVGGAWSVSYGPAADEMYHDEGVLEVVDPPHRLVYTALMRFPDREPFQTVTTVTFEATLDGKTSTVMSATINDAMDGDGSATQRTRAA